MLATILLLAISVGSALLFAFLVSKGLITVTSARTPSVLLVASSDKWDNITQLELRSQAGETLKTQDLGLRIEGWMENSQGGRQYVRFYIPSLSTQRQAVQAEFYQYDWGRVLYVWCLENSVGMGFLAPRDDGGEWRKREVCELHQDKPRALPLKEPHLLGRDAPHCFSPRSSADLSWSPPGHPLRTSG
jgi:hypothetical protein